MLDEVWLSDLLSEVQSPVTAPNVKEFHDPNPTVIPQLHGSRVDWDDALVVTNFYGCEWELSQLCEWVNHDRCLVVGILGLGGVGKSALSISLMHQKAVHFDVVIWRSLCDAPMCEALLDERLHILEPLLPGHPPMGIERRLDLLLDHLRGQRVLLVLDNLETLLPEGEDTASMRPSYESYEKLLRRVGETKHQSCLLFTSREKPIDLARLEGKQSPVRMLRLARLEAKPCEQLLAEKGVTGSASDLTRLIDTYTGNPLALKIVAQTIVDLFDGEMAPFLEQGEVIFGSIRDFLAEQFVSMSALERNAITWLAILREPATLDELQIVLATPVPRVQLLEAMLSLYRRSLIERGQKQGSFTLQSVVLEYVTIRLIARVVDEIREGKPARLIENALEFAQAREYVRQTQERLIVTRILEQLRSLYPDVKKRLLTLLAQFVSLNSRAQGYEHATALSGIIRTCEPRRRRI